MVTILLLDTFVGSIFSFLVFEMQKNQNKDNINKVVIMNVSESGKNYLYDYLLKNHPNDEYMFINYDNKINFDYYNNSLFKGINFIRIERKKRIDQLNILIRFLISQGVNINEVEKIYVSNSPIRQLLESNFKHAKFCVSWHSFYEGVYDGYPSNLFSKLKYDVHRYLEIVMYGISKFPRRMTNKNRKLMVIRQNKLMPQFKQLLINLNNSFFKDHLGKSKIENFILLLLPDSTNAKNFMNKCLEDIKENTKKNLDLNLILKIHPGMEYSNSQKKNLMQIVEMSKLNVNQVIWNTNEAAEILAIDRECKAVYSHPGTTIFLSGMTRTHGFCVMVYKGNDKKNFKEYIQSNSDGLIRELIYD
jgi:hypothetical protein